eukprot:m.9478 g.9478  ORF g.9478 m.9478 type:complete len:227 (+) comp5542_c0_seq1:284-964(+)
MRGFSRKAAAFLLTSFLLGLKRCGKPLCRRQRCAAATFVHLDGGKRQVGRTELRHGKQTNGSYKKVLWCHFFRLANKMQRLDQEILRLTLRHATLGLKTRLVAAASERLFFTADQLPNEKNEPLLAQAAACEQIKKRNPVRLRVGPWGKGEAQLFVKNGVLCLGEESAWSTTTDSPVTIVEWSDQLDGDLGKPVACLLKERHDQFLWLDEMPAAHDLKTMTHLFVM